MKYQPIKLNFKEFPKKEIKKRSEEFYNMIKTRKSVRNGFQYNTYASRNKHYSVR